MKKTLISAFIIGSAAFVLSSCTVPSSQTDSSYNQATQAVTVNDASLETNINNTIKSLVPTNAFPHNVYAVVWKGYTLLLGQAQSQDLADRIVKAISQVYGVDNTKLVDRIVINPNFNATALNVVRDTAITTDVRSRLLLTKGIDSLLFKVITEGKQVYLLSKADEEQTNLAATIAKAVQGVRSVNIIYAK